MTKIKYLVLLMCAVVFSVNAQESADSNDVEEVVVTGTQIKGARINEALPVTVITAELADPERNESGLSNRSIGFSVLAGLAFLIA